jgi:hypothetical protein
MVPSLETTMSERTRELTEAELDDVSGGFWLLDLLRFDMEHYYEGDVPDPFRGPIWIRLEITNGEMASDDAIPPTVTSNRALRRPVHSRAVTEARLPG